MAREPSPTWFFALAVVRLGHRFLLVHERKHGQRWYLPAGRVEPGETFVEAAQRETLEEAGVPIAVEGVLRIEHTPQPAGGARVRAILVGRPQDDTPPKSQPDEESLAAGWFSVDEMRALDLRGEEAVRFCEHVAAGGPVYPLSLLTYEGAPF